MSQPRILVTNDDGIHGPGLHALADAMRTLGDVTVIAPDKECSAISHGFTLHSPLRAREVEPGVIILNGTPVDCVIYARTFYDEVPPDLVVSGINNGPNLGCDVFYSGTVAAAHEGQLQGAPSLAVSIDTSHAPDTGQARGYRFDTAAEIARRIAERVLGDGLPADTMLNLNVPNVELNNLQGVRVTRLGRRIYRDVMIKRQDPRGADYYWIGGDPPAAVEEPDSDFQAVQQGYASLTPLRWDINDPQTAAQLTHWV